MNKEQIKLVKSWFKNERHTYGTYYTVNDYYVCTKDVKMFMIFLNKVFRNLKEFNCSINLNGIHFTKSDMEKALFFERD